MKSWSVKIPAPFPSPKDLLRHWHFQATTFSVSTSRADEIYQALRRFNHVEAFSKTISRPYRSRLNFQCTSPQPAFSFRYGAQPLAHVRPPSTLPDPPSSPLPDQSCRSLRPRRTLSHPPTPVSLQRLKQRYGVCRC